MSAQLLLLLPSSAVSHPSPIYAIEDVVAASMHHIWRMPTPTTLVDYCRLHGLDTRKLCAPRDDQADAEKRKKQKLARLMRAVRLLVKHEMVDPVDGSIIDVVWGRMFEPVFTLTYFDYQTWYTAMRNWVAQTKKLAWHAQLIHMPASVVTLGQMADYLDDHPAVVTVEQAQSAFCTVTGVSLAWPEPVYRFSRRA